MGITEKQKSKRRKIAAAIIIPLFTLLLIYCGIAIYFNNHFYFGTQINSISVSGESVETVKEQMTTELMSYTLNLKERGGKNEQITAAELGLKYTPDKAFENFKKEQDPLKWILEIFNTEDSKMTMGISYDQKLLKEKIDNLSCFGEANVVEPQNPSFKYTDNGYIIVNEVSGNKVNKDILYENVANAILRGQTELDLESIDCYINPQYTSNSQKIVEAQDLLNTYVSSKVTYKFGSAAEVIDGSIINKWLTVDDNFGVTIDEKKAKDFINTLSKKYTPTGSIRNFATSSGNTINVDGGDYDWKINIAKEVQDLCAAIKDGKTMTKELSYIQTAYVEIDLTRQHLWFYKNGSLIIEGDIVSGHAGGSLATPAGVYKLKNKKKDAILRGPGYAAHVKFWMPFNGGIGIHDATWRRAFGGEIYKTDGSHGCINCPLSLAESIFNNIDTGTPIICYY